MEVEDGRTGPPVRTTRRTRPGERADHDRRTRDPLRKPLDPQRNRPGPPDPLDPGMQRGYPSRPQHDRVGRGASRTVRPPRRAEVSKVRADPEPVAVSRAPLTEP